MSGDPDSDDLDCKTVSRMLSDDQDKPLSPQQRLRLQQHFLICQACRNVDAQVRFLRSAIRLIGKRKDDLPS